MVKTRVLCDEDIEQVARDFCLLALHFHYQLQLNAVKIVWVMEINWLTVESPRQKQD